MNKLTLTKLDNLNMITKIINEQELSQFDENEIGLLNFIFERELKPPFRKGEKDEDGFYPYYNSDNKLIGWLDSDKDFSINYDPFGHNIEDKIYLAFGDSPDVLGWWDPILPHLKSWMEDQLNTKLLDIR